MKKDPFTMQAAILWGTVPKEDKERILKNCFCPKCRQPAEMLEPRGVEKKGDLVLTGKCGRCGGKVVRILETSEIRLENN